MTQYPLAMVVPNFAWSVKAGFIIRDQTCHPSIGQMMSIGQPILSPHKHIHSLSRTPSQEAGKRRQQERAVGNGEEFRKAGCEEAGEAGYEEGGEAGLEEGDEAAREKAVKLVSKKPMSLPGRRR